MKRHYLLGIGALVLGATLVTSAVALAAAPKDISIKHLVNSGIKSADGAIVFEYVLPNLSAANFIEKGTGTPEFLGALVNTANRNQLFISVRSSVSGQYPYVARVYRYTFSSQKLERVYREAKSNGYTPADFDGSKLVLLATPYGDDSPGPCWMEDAVSAKGVKYLSTATPAAGLKAYKQSKAAAAAHAKIAKACENSLTAGQ